MLQNGSEFAEGQMPTTPSLLFEIRAYRGPPEESGASGGSESPTPRDDVGGPSPPPCGRMRGQRGAPESLREARRGRQRLIVSGKRLTRTRRRLPNADDRCQRQSRCPCQRQRQCHSHERSSLNRHNRYT